VNIEIPESFVASTVGREGAAGLHWIRSLPEIVRHLCEKWQLVIDGDATHGYVGLVVPVRQEGIDRILKVSWMDDSSAQESTALRLWNGRGAVRLIEEDAELGALLLERLDPNRTLEEVPVREAVVTAGSLLRRLAIPATVEVRTVAAEAANLHRSLPGLWERTGRPFPKGLLDRTLELIEGLVHQDASLVVNIDLHYGNVLAGEREPWLVIDPKILAGELEFGVAQLLWNRIEDLETASDLDARLSLLCDVAELELERARSWSIVRIVDSWLWALSVGLTEDPKRCRLLVDWLT